MKYDSTVILNTVKGIRPLRHASPEITDEVWSVLLRCWNNHPEIRPTMRTLALFFNLSRRPTPRLTNSDIQRIFDTDTVVRPVPKRDGNGRFSVAIRSVWGCDRTRAVSLNMCSLWRSSKGLKQPSETPLPYPCNWSGCGRSFTTLDECQSHEAKRLEN